MSSMPPLNEGQNDTPKVERISSVLDTNIKYVRKVKIHEECEMYIKEK